MLEAVEWRRDQNSPKYLNFKLTLRGHGTTEQMNRLAAAFRARNAIEIQDYDDINGRTLTMEVGSEYRL